MNKPRLLKLCKALESGKYKQGRHSLRNGDRFCCLGVACDISKTATKGKWDKDDQFIAAGERKMGVLPPVVADYFGISHYGGEFNTEKHSSLIQLNDMGWSFKRIAARIRKAAGLPKQEK